MKLCSIMKTNLINDNKEQITQLIIYNSNTELVVPFSSITLINDPELSDVLQCPDDIDAASMIRISNRREINNCEIPLIQTLRMMRDIVLVMVQETLECTKELYKTVNKERRIAESIIIEGTMNEFMHGMFIRQGNSV